MSFDEFEMQIYAVGNIKGKLYKQYEELLELNSEDVANELKKYVKDDTELLNMIEYMPYDEEVLKEREGNAFFVVELNWLTAKLINNATGETLRDDIILDTDNIMEALSNKDLLFDCIFSENQTYD